MRKLFILISVLALSIIANAAVINITPTSPKSSNNLRQAINAAASGDIIEMAAGTYDESGDWLAFYDKEITVRAAEGAEVILKPHVSVRVKAPNAAAKAEFIGIKFDCSEVGDYSELFVAADNYANQKVVLTNCEFYNWTKNGALIHSTTARRLDVIEINNCYFHNCLKSCIFLENANLASLSITNSTFADITTAESYYAAPIDVRSTSGEVLVDHCTFYNVNTMSSSYGVIYVTNISDVTISNSIFAFPSTVNRYAVSCVAGSTIDYCLAYNTNGFNGVTSTNDRTGNPYFMNTNPANYDFTIWTTSPAHGTADDGEDLGDYLRWNTDPATHVATINITDEATNSLKAAVDAALPGDEIILAAGTYEESESISLDKEITIKAAAGAHPIVKPVGNFAISNAANITIQNINFDGTSHTADNFIYAADATNNSLAIEGCDFYNFSHAVIAATDSKLIGTCSVNKCYFYNNTNSCVCLKNSAAANLTVTNSTFKNIDGSSVAAGLVESKTATGTLLVDHCTFYNCQVYNTDNGTVKVASPNATVSNCIFAMPTSTSSLRTVYIPSGLAAGTTVTNCVMHNYTYDSNIGVPSRTGSVISNCNAVDPLFTDAANGDFSFPCNWSTGAFSPALGAATDGSDLGDPRWYSDEVLPSSDFAYAYDLLPTKAQYAGTVELNASNKIHFKNTDVVTDGEVKWKLNVTRSCRISAVVDVETGCTSGRQLALTVKDADGNTVATLTQASATYNDADINLGEIVFEEAGNYTFLLTNSLPNSGVVLEKITLTYEGGAVQNIATDANTTLNVADAWFTSGATRAEGQISYESWNTEASWVKWNIATSETKFYDLTLNFSSDNAHSMAVNIYEDEEASPVATVSESYTSTTGTLTISNRINLAGGKNYVVKVTNPVGGSHAKVTSVVFAPVVSSVVSLPGTLGVSDALMVGQAFVENSKIYFAPYDQEAHIADENANGSWVIWNVTTDHAGSFLFTMNVNSSNGQSYKTTILDSEENIVDFFEMNPGSGEKEIKHFFNLAAGNYSVKVQNKTNWSHGHIVSLVVTEPDDIVVIDETEASMSVLNAENRQGNKNYQIIRTIVPGMYNTICLPFDLTNAELKAAFGSDVVLKEMESATVEAGDYVLNLNFKEATTVRRCRPYLIKTSRNIINPVFGDVEVKIDDASEYITTGTNANFVSTLIKGSIPASENNLFLGANNTLYFPGVATEILGMRAYFVIHDDVPAGAIKRARIIEREEVATDIETVESQESRLKSQKVLRDGQLIIVRDGQKYNVMGIKLQ